MNRNTLRGRTTARAVRPLSGKRTSLIGWPTSANDPKQTFLPYRLIHLMQINVVAKAIS